MRDIEGDVEGVAFLSAQKTIGVVERAQHRLLLVVAEVLTLRAAVDQLAIVPVAVGEAAGNGYVSPRLVP